ncbi:sulfatase-like hydrolase/transferase [Lentisphaera marina]|uniref:sulfatase-like hydrolase/transferase n=1 Tax=Lentisphaera marina TaxID=1111041 RepID=UPI00236579E6|nr:sulfatase-like hydrolase/transferase [Lentisphaera marina]MDD7983811.1 sulfatase-like hydrolase/transferase [Lentisphaera marina]
MKKTYKKFKHLVLGLGALACANSLSAEDALVYDGEYDFLRMQYGEKWDKEDIQLDNKLDQIRKSNKGKSPNIIYVLIDDVSYGLMGNRAMNFVTGIDTPNINKFAKQGMTLHRMYTEPSCTPTRTAFMTGRHPVRSGLKEVKVALVGEGLGTSEVTIAEVLKSAGYNTSHVGKWHMGDIEEAYPHNQGFDYAAFPLHQQVQLALMSPDSARANNLFGYDRSTQSNEYELDKKFRPSGLVTGVEAKRGGQAYEVDLKAGEQWTQAHYIKMNHRYQRQALEQIDSLAKKDKPFFFQYWPLWPLNFTHDGQAKSRNGGTMAEKLQQIDVWFGEITKKVDDLGIADNTMIVFMADNGIMRHYSSTMSGLSQLIYRGGKTDHLEGGVRVDAFVRWPAGIKAGSEAGDIVHVSDLYTTFARVANAKKYIPRDRVIDGVDQTALLLNGNHHGRRDYVYIYENEVLRSIVKQEFKMHLPPPGVPGAAANTYNVLRDPREENPHVGIPLWSGASFQDMAKRHMIKIMQYPHRPLGKGVPYSGIANLRPESKETAATFASWQPKMPPKAKK